MGISRIEQFEKTNFGYYVRLKRDGRQYAKFFSDSRFGGQQNALKAAQDYLNELSEQLPRRSQAGQISTRNTSGIVGVSQTKSTRKGHTYEYWQAWWGSGGDRKSRKFSINKYGTQKAKQLAIETRKIWEQEAQVSMT
ncbi:MAG: AP2/ERF family transcription factor [Cyanobacteria bacterium P01_E01_bin.6]